MKIRFTTFATLLGAIMLLACSDELKVQLDIPDADCYSSVYLPQANNIPMQKNVYITTDIQSIPITAYYGGPKTPGQNINIEFEVRPDLVEEYNESYSTDYAPLPESCYSLSGTSSYIRVGEQRSMPITIDIVAEGSLEIAKSYLLPVSIKHVDGAVPVVESLRTVYFLITGSYMPGKVPREKVYSFGRHISKPIFCRGNELLRIDEENCLQVYQLDENGAYGSPRCIGEGWEDVDIMFYMPQDRFIYRNPAENMVQLDIDENYNTVNSREIGWGWGGALIVFPFKDLALVAVNGENITKYPLDQNGNFDFSNISDIESTGWGRYTWVCAYKNNLIALEANGDLWAVPLSDNFVAGTKKKIGTGWNMYERLIPCGDDLLALDVNGDLWRYQFDPAAYWPLKAEDAEP